MLAQANAALAEERADNEDGDPRGKERKAGDRDTVAALMPLARLPPRWPEAGAALSVLPQQPHVFGYDKMISPAEVTRLVR
jgi:hypothetical protein